MLQRRQISPSLVFIGLPVKISYLPSAVFEFITLPSVVGRDGPTVLLLEFWHYSALSLVYSQNFQ